MSVAMQENVHSAPRGWAAQFIGANRVGAFEDEFVKKTLDAVCHAFDISREQLVAEKKADRLLPRYVAAHILRTEGGVSYPRIANELRYKDHTSVISALDTFNSLAKRDVAIPKLLTALRSQIAEMLSPEFSPNQLSLVDAIERPLFAVPIDGAEGKPSVRPAYFATNVKRAVCEAFGVTEQRLLSPSRDASIVLPRWIAMHVMRSESSMSLPQIALALRRQDHTTVSYGLQQLEKRVDADPTLKKLVSEITERAIAMPAPKLGAPRL